MRSSRWIVGLAVVAVGAIGISKLVSALPIRQGRTADGYPTAGGLVVYDGVGWGGSVAEGRTYARPIVVKNTSSHDVELRSLRTGSPIGSVELGKPFVIVSPLAGGVGFSVLTPELASRGVPFPVVLGPGQDAALMLTFVAPPANKSKKPAFEIRQATIDITSGGRSASILVAASTDGCPRGPEVLTEADPLTCI